MRYEVLGPLEVVREGQAVDVGGRKQRALLAILLIERNHVVAAERIIDRLWDGRPPATASGTLQGYLSHLRKALHGPGEQRTRRLVTQGTGYMLVTAPDEVDADRFVELSRAGAAALAADDHYGACEILDQALSLWRGPAYSDFAGEAFAREEQVRLDELHAQATEDRMEAALALGRHSRVISELQTLVSRHPLRERLRGQLMVAMYRSGRQVEALEVYRSGRERLAEELGIDPGPELQQLEAAILRQDPSLSYVPAAAVPAGAAASAGAGGAAVIDRAAAPAPALAPAPAPAPASAPALALAPAPAPAPAPGGGSAPPLTSAAPAAPPAIAPRSNLAAPLTPIIGRDRELADLADLLEANRLVTLTGPGGTGKTRLATEIARRVTAPDGDGPWVVELACLSEPKLVPNAVAQALDLVVQGDQPVVELAATALNSRDALIFLDNCEHLIGPVAELSEKLLARCPNVRILATSREPLQVQGEAVYNVSPLPVADRTAEARLVDGDAMRLFEARAAAVVPGFTINAENRKVIRQICQDLDGLPLAIELAAARLRLLAPEQLAEHLGDRFSLLAGGSRTAQPRQRALRAAVEWSYDLLDETEQRLFCMLSIFRGGFELDAVAQLWDGPPAQALDVLDALVTKSLVTVDTSVTPRRYGMLQTLREYARQRLTPEQTDALARRHARWCGELTTAGEAALRGPDWLRWLPRLDAEHDNFRAAVAYALEVGDPDLAAHITGPLGWYWFRRGHVDEARQWLERCEAVRGDAVSEPWSRVVLSLGTVRYLSGDVDEARRLGNEAIALARASEAPLALVQGLVYSAYFEAIADCPGARRRAQEGLDLVRTLDVPWLEAEALTALSNLARAAGDYDEAEALVLAGTEVAKQAGYWWQERMSRWTAAKVSLERGQADVAVERLRGVVQDLAAAGDRSGAVLALHALAGAVAKTRSPRTGALLLGAVAMYSERLGFFPERIDPGDAIRIHDGVRELLPDDEFTQAFQQGRELPRGELAALVDELAGA